MQKQRKINELRRVLKDDGFLKRDELVTLCPKHDHQKRKLSINLSTDVFHCWVCGWGGNILKILKLNGKTEISEEYERELREKSGHTEQKEKTYQQPRLPKEFKTLSEAHRSPYVRQAMEYLSRRGVTADDIRLYKLGFCEDGEYANRIIFPSFDRFGELNFFVGRSIIEGISGAIKYRHGEFDKDIIFNELFIDWKKPVVLVEGPFDALKAGTNAIALQSNQLNVETQLMHRLITSDVSVYVALDNDAWSNCVKMVHDLSAYGVRAIPIDLSPHKDPGEMTKEEFKQTLDVSIPDGSEFAHFMKLAIRNDSRVPR